MVDIRCTSPITSSPRTDSIITEEGDIATFPQGEMEYSIYRPADGKGVDMVFTGYTEDQLAQAGALLDTLETATPEFIGETKKVYTQKKEQLSNISQAIHKNPAYYKQVKEQFEKQVCPRYRTNLDVIPLSPLLVFMKCSLVETPDRPLNETQAILARRSLSENTDLPFQVFTQVMGYSVLANIDVARFNQKFEDTVVREKERQRLVKCFRYYDTGVVPEGELLDLAIDVDTSRASVDQGLRTSSVNQTRTGQPSGFTSLHDSLSSVPQEYSYKLGTPFHRVVFKNEVSEIFDFEERVDTGDLRFNRDVHVSSDFFVTEYNVDIDEETSHHSPIFPIA